MLFHFLKVVEKLGSCTQSE